MIIHPWQHLVNRQCAVKQNAPNRCILVRLGLMEARLFFSFRALAGL
jgi:hypothetical protein